MPRGRKPPAKATPQLSAEEQAAVLQDAQATAKVEAGVPDDPEPTVDVSAEELKKRARAEARKLAAEKRKIREAQQAQRQHQLAEAKKIMAEEQVETPSVVSSAPPWEEGEKIPEDAPRIVLFLEGGVVIRRSFQLQSEAARVIGTLSKLNRNELITAAIRDDEGVLWMLGKLCAVQIYNINAMVLHKTAGRGLKIVA